MKRRREPTPEERAQFHEALKDPVQFRNKVAPGREKTAAKPAKSVPDRPDVAVSSSVWGVDGRTADRLDRGAVAPQARLDLHGMTERAAHHALAAFVRGAAARGHRLVLVVTGKGLPVDPYEPFDLELDRRRRGVLKALVPRWLREPGLARLVADARPAHRRHGGEGALYIYLRKPG